MILKKCINGSMILIDGINEAQVYEDNKIFWVRIQRGKETETHRLDEPAYILNDEGKTIERLPYCKPDATKFEAYAKAFNRKFNASDKKVNL